MELEKTLIDRIICKNESERRECIKNLEGLGYVLGAGSRQYLEYVDCNKVLLYDNNTFELNDNVSIPINQKPSDFSYRIWKTRILNERGVLPYSEPTLEDLVAKFIQGARDIGYKASVTFESLD